MPSCRRRLQFALKQPEPARSRSLSMLVESQAKAGDPNGAARTMISAIREYPGLEKRRALGSLADWYEKAGDQRDRDHVSSPGVETRGGQTRRQNLRRRLRQGQADDGRSRARSFVDFEDELRLKGGRAREVVGYDLLATLALGEQEKALSHGAVVAGWDGRSRHGESGRESCPAGDVAGAFKLAASLETPQQRLMAYDLAAIAIRQDRQGNKPDR